MLNDDFHKPPIEQLDIVLVSKRTIDQVEREITA